MQITRCLDRGMSLLVGTADALNIPVCCRAVALASSDDVQHVTVYLPVATSHETIQNLATTKHIAIAATNPIDHFSMQLKGTPVETRLAREDEREFVRTSFDGFAGILDSIGIPAALTRNASCWPAFAVTVRVEQVFDQTPGPKAGTRVR